MDMVVEIIIPIWQKLGLGLLGACAPKFIEFYYNGGLITVENRHKRNPKISMKVQWALEIIWVLFGTFFAVAIGTTYVNIITAGMGWEALLLAISRGDKK